jgi:hypothetical protein
MWNPLVRTSLLKGLLRIPLPTAEPDGVSGCVSEVSCLDLLPSAIPHAARQRVSWELASWKLGVEVQLILIRSTSNTSMPRGVPASPL